jgi:hypothetical protein
MYKHHVQNERRASACPPRGTFEKHERATWQSYVLSEFVRSVGPSINRNAQHETPPKRTTMENYRSTFAGRVPCPASGFSPAMRYSRALKRLTWAELHTCVGSPYIICMLRRLVVT